MYDNSVVEKTKEVIKPSERVKGCILKEVTFTEGKYLDFIFEEKSTGATLRHREFEPTGKDGDKDKLKISINNFQQRVIHILEGYLSPTKVVTIKGNDFESYCKAIVAAISSTEYNKIDTELKVIYKGKYAAFPLFPNFVSTTKKPTVFKNNPQYDKYEILETPDVEKEDDMSSMFGDIPPETKEKEEMPFIPD